MKRWLVLSLLCGLFATPSWAQEQEFDFYARGPYQESIPRPEKILGYAIGARHTYYYQMEDYIQALAAASPRVRVEPYGESYEGRKMYLIIISAEENLAQLEAIRERIARLADLRLLAGEAELNQLVATTPAIAWMNYANDGNESAAFECGMQMAYQLAAGEDATTRLIRARIVTILNLAHNPESHERFVAWYNAILQGRYGNPDPAAAEHTGDWLMDSNDNHYHIDLNRDAVALSQQETQAVVAAMQRWKPQVFIDHHGNPPIFFFPPTPPPRNENLGPFLTRWEQIFGQAMGAAFARYGWSFMNREVFDLFYPGYFDIYPSLNGAIGMTFETDGGGSQGLRLERADKTFSSLRGGIAKHFTASLATLEAAAEKKDELLRDFYRFRQTAMEEAERGLMKQFVLLDDKEAGRSAAALVALLLRHGIEVYRARSAFSSARAHSYFGDAINRREFPAGSYVVPLKQPQKRLLKALLEPEAKLSEEFVAEEQARRARNESLGRRAEKERPRFYDITAWSLPLSFGVEAYWTEDTAPAPLDPVTSPPATPGGIEGGRAAYAYVFGYESNASLKLMAQLLKEEFRLAVARASFTLGEKAFAPGTIILRVERNPARLHERIGELAVQTGVRVLAVNSAATDAGITLGSHYVQDLKPPRIAVAAYEPTSGRSYGSLWFLFEQVLDYPFTPIRTQYLRRADFSKYDVIILPDGSDAAYEAVLGKEGLARLKAWVEAGGVLIGLKGGAALATRKDVEWTSARLVGRPGPAPPGKEPEKPAAEPEKEVALTPGAIVRVELNPAHFLAFGYAPEQIVLHNSNLIFTPSKDGTNVASYAKEKLRVSGFIWSDTEARLAGSAYLMDENLGSGHVILFADDPNFRLLWPRLTRLFGSSVFFAPSLR